MTEDEFIECLHESRNGWITMQTLDVVRGLLPSGERAASYPLLARRVSDDDLAMATVLTRIAADDAAARAPDAMADWLIMAGLAHPDLSAAEVAGYLVSPVVRRVRHDGVPWPRWWDAHGLHLMFVELWTARQLSNAPPDLVGCELRTIWQVPDELIPATPANAASPFSLLPPDLFKTSLTGEATKLLRGLFVMGKLRFGIEDWLPRYLPELNDRPDLIEVVRRVRLRHDLEGAVRRYVRDFGSQEQERLHADLVSWDEQLARLLRALTTHEAELLVEPGQETAYRDRCLVAGRSYWLYPLLEEDALPSQIVADEPPGLAPLWIQDEIIGGGARTFRTNVGPHPVWLFTADTSLGEAAVEALRLPGQGYGLGHRVENNLVEIRLQLPVPDDDPGPALEAPFSYPLDHVNSAWQLLHLAAVGHVRLVVLKLTRDGALLVRGSIMLSLPDEMRDDLTDHALTALRSLVGDDMQALLWRRAVDEPEDISFATFHANETAKGEELLDEITCEAPPGVQPYAWAAFQEASRSLARARAIRAAAAADGRHVPELAAAVDQAIEDRQRARDMARNGSGTLDRQARKGALAAALPDEQTAFIHFFTKNGTLQAIYLTRDRRDASFSPVYPSLINEAPLLEVVEEWVNTGPGTPDWHQALSALLEVLMERIIQPLAEELYARGVTRLIISPTPPLDLLPLHAVPVIVNDAIRPLCEVFDEVIYMPTVRMMTTISARPASAAASPLIIAHSGTGVPGVQVIRGPALEAAILRDLYPGARTMAERGAAPREVLAAMTGSRVVHIASHADTPGDRWAVGLVLDGEKRGQAILRAADVLADGDLAGTELVVLNACRTGSHRSAARVVQTVRGLEAAFLARGARTIISTFWEINDLTAVAFASLLHASIADGDPPGKAYRKAVAYLRSEGWHRQDCPEVSIHRAETLLDREAPDWRKRLDVQIKSNPLSWSAFKITGVT